MLEWVEQIHSKNFVWERMKCMSTTQGAKRQGSIAQRVWDIVLPTADELEYVLWDVEFVKEGADYYLRITIDHPEGITIDDCEAVHRAIDPLLDEADPIESAYYLDVSSAGIERDLRTDAHILASIGQRCEAKLFAPLNGARAYRGELVSLTDGVVTLKNDQGEVEIPQSAISKLKTLFFD